MLIYLLNLERCKGRVTKFALVNRPMRAMSRVQVVTPQAPITVYAPSRG